MGMPKAQRGLFVSGMISLGFVETNAKQIVRKPRNLSPLSLIASAWTW
jgi:hypothetical protein